MTLTLTANISSSADELQITGTVPAEIARGYLFTLGSSTEILRLRGFALREWPDLNENPGRNTWLVARAQQGTDAAGHTAGDAVKGVVDAFVAGTSEAEPDPFPGGGGDSGPLAFSERVLSENVTIPDNKSAVVVGPFDLNGHTVTYGTNSALAVLPENIAAVPVVYRVSVDDSDIPDPGDRLDLLDLPIGTSVLSWWTDPDTYVPWDFDTGMGQGPEWEAFTLSGQPDYATIPGFLGEPAHGADTFSRDAELNARPIPGGDYGRRNRAGVLHQSPLLHISATGPIQIANIGLGAVVGGHVDIEFLVALQQVTP